MLDILHPAALRPADFNETVEFIVPGFLPKRQITMVYADGGNGKSWLGFALANECAAQGYRVVYLDFDNPLSVLAQRGVEQKLISRHKNLYYVQRSKSKLPASDMLETLASRAVSGAFDDHIVIMDSLRNFGDVTHDAQIMRTMDRIMDLREAGATIVVLHHSNKDGRNYQGSNNIRNSVDNMYRLRKRELASGIGLLLEATKERANIMNKAFDVCPQTLTLAERDMTEALATEEDMGFIGEIKAVLQQKPGINKTDLLRAVGYEKDDKTARTRLDKYEGVYWSAIKRGNRYCYEQVVQPLQQA